jgi:hypothetical protein
MCVEAPRASAGETPRTATVVARIRLREAIENAEDGLSDMRRSRRPEVYDTEGTR